RKIDGGAGGTVGADGNPGENDPVAEVGARERRRGREDAELRTAQARAGDHVTGREVTEHPNGPGDILPHRYRLRVPGPVARGASVCGAYVEGPQNVGDEERGLAQLPVIRFRTSYPARLRMEQYGPHHRPHIAAHAGAVVVKHLGDIADVIRRRIAGDELLYEL